MPKDASDVRWNWCKTCSRELQVIHGLSNEYGIVMSCLGCSSEANIFFVRTTKESFKEVTKGGEQWVKATRPGQ